MTAQEHSRIKKHHHMNVVGHNHKLFNNYILIMEVDIFYCALDFQTNWR